MRKILVVVLLIEFIRFGLNLHCSLNNALNPNYYIKILYKNSQSEKLKWNTKTQYFWDYYANDTFNKLSTDEDLYKEIVFIIFIDRKLQDTIKFE